MASVPLCGATPFQVGGCARLLTPALLLLPLNLSAGPFSGQVGRREGGILGRGTAPGKVWCLGTDRTPRVERGKAPALAFPGSCWHSLGKCPPPSLEAWAEGLTLCFNPCDNSAPSQEILPSFFPSLFPSFSLNTSVCIS